MEMGGVISRIDCETTDEFLKTLSSVRSLGGALFRGHSSAEYRLLPTAYRPDGFKKLWCLLREPRGKPFEPKEISEMNRAELGLFHGRIESLMYKFFGIANARAALALNISREDFMLLDPRGSPRAARQKSPEKTVNSPAEYMLPALSLMQRHGLPTPLLDWTESPLKACFFAAEGAKPGQTEDLAVYYLNRNFFHVLFDHCGPEAHAADWPQVYFPQYAGNQNLYAQTGAFTYTPRLRGPSGSEGGDNAGVLPLDEEIKRILFKVGPECANLIFTHCGERPILHKITLPPSELGNLRAHLVEHEVTHSAIYPGLDGVRREIEAGWKP